MKKLLLLSAFLITTMLNAQNNDIKRVITTFFEGLHTSDTLKIQSVCSKDIVIQSIIKNTEGLKHVITPQKLFYELISAIPKDITIEERLLDYTIQVDGGMAHVWTPYEFYVQNKLVHTGVNSFQLYKSAEGWKIVYILDTRNKVKDE